jgi:hypothetical protein
MALWPGHGSATASNLGTLGQLLARLLYPGHLLLLLLGRLLLLCQFINLALPLGVELFSYNLVREILPLFFSFIKTHPLTL